MSQSTEPVPGAGPVDPPPRSRVAFERLRERTDELELIISGLLAFALLTVPGRVFDAWAANSIHVEGVYEYAVWLGFATSVGLGYSLAFAFLVHLATRGYWVALVGLKATFGGIRWERIPMMGAVSRAHYRARIGELGDAIDRADRIASMLFAMAILLALSVAWMSLLAILAIAIAAVSGLLLGDMDRIAKALLLATYVAFVAIGVLPYLLEKHMAYRARRGHESPRTGRLVHGLLRVYSVVVPQRLILPVQLTLQSNLPGRGFMAVYLLVVMVAMVFGAVLIANSTHFSMLHRYDVLTTEAVAHGMASVHYEDMRGEHDVLHRVPMIPSDRIAGTHLRLFVPHQPQRDNPLARKRCAGLAGGTNARRGEDAATLAADCLAGLWTATLDGEPVALEDFLPIERRDLGLRGLVGYLPVAALPPGRHDLRMTWNADGPAEGPLERRDFRIPFWTTPAISQDATTR